MDPPFSSRMGPTAWVYLPCHSRRSRMAPPVHEFSAISASRPRSTPGFHMLDHLQEQAYALAELKLSCKWYVPVVAHARLTEEEGAEVYSGEGTSSEGTTPAQGD